MNKVSIIEVQSALTILFNEIQSEEGSDAYSLLYLYIAQQRENQIKNGTLVVKK